MRDTEQTYYFRQVVGMRGRSAVVATTDSPVTYTLNLADGLSIVDGDAAISLSVKKAEALRDFLNANLT